MTTIEMEQKISISFHGGEIVCRELRLTAEEVTYLRQTYPCAQITPLPTHTAWYHVQFPPLQ